MSQIIYPKIEGAIIKVIGIFDYDKKFQQNLESSFGYTVVPVIDFKNAQFYRDKYYKEFNELMLTRTAKNATKTYEKSLSSKILFKKFETIEKSGVIEKREKEIVAEISHLELKLFENNIGIFAMTVMADSLNFQEISDLTYCLRFFSTQVEGENIPLHMWISKHVLGGKSLRTSEVNKVDSDDYSGSKFKIYSAFSVDETNIENYDRNELLFELGTASKLGSVSAKNYDTPSDEYYDEIMNNKVSAFNSSTALALLDSYTVIGHDLFYSNGEIHRNNFSSYNNIYFSIYLFNLYIKYNVFRFNSKFKEDAVKYKSRFEDFINDYNYSHISFDFLPNLIYSKMRAALGIENEIKQFEKRLNSLAANIQEEQEKRQALLLGFISVISSISAIEPILETAEQVRDFTGLESNLFYALLSIVFIAIAISILSYLFPHIAKKVWKKLNLYFKND
jgi:hypothetical protein